MRWPWSKPKVVEAPAIKMSIELVGIAEARKDLEDLKAKLIEVAAQAEITRSKLDKFHSTAGVG